ncbi:hypothetical protein BUALT_Bualt07G0051300 [Buddleja alternifolia]|uniref:Uncharacterized protein n=1 Tax=Buddleja alternifolia TaxID=168488 RepID=A0AAV6X971_9LAMI|nr:hypothetical protein BUALT_Bualt07G0051300 [Buddleja alternifolia]
MVKTPSSDTHMQNDFWNEDDERKMARYSSNHGTGLRKSGKSSRQKWSNNQKTDPRHMNFSPQEEELVIQLHAAIGSRWPIIAQQFPGKTDNDVKILWNSKLRKKLSAMGIDPVTHKPFSQILADYGNIGAFPKARTRFTSLSRDLKSAIMLKSERPQTFSNSDNHLLAPKLLDRPELSDNHHSLDLYSQLQTINLVTEASNYTKNENTIQHVMTECASSSDSLNDEITSFSWSDFLLEDAFSPANVVEQENKGNQSLGGVEDNKNGEIIELVEGFEASSSSNTSFVEAMIESQDEMFSQFSWII